MPAQPGFPLSFPRPLLAGFSAPSSAFDPKANWKARYRTHCLVGNAKAPNGTFEIERAASGDGSLLRIRYERSRGLNRVHVLKSEVRCASDALATPRMARAPGQVSHEWSLIEAVQRLPRTAFPLLRFHLLTHDGMLLPNHTVGYRGAVEVDTAGGVLRLHGYQHMGTGILPWVYYTADSGRLLVAVSGLQAWLYEGTKA